MKGGERGLTMTELLVGVAILSIVIASMLPMFMGNLTLNKRSEDRTQASTIAQRVLDGYRLENPSSPDFPRSGSLNATLQDGSGRDWAYRVTFCPDPSFCSDNSRGVKVDVMDNGKTLYSAETVYTQLFFELQNGN